MDMWFLSDMDIDKRDLDDWTKRDIRFVAFPVARKMMHIYRPWHLHYMFWTTERYSCG